MTAVRVLHCARKEGFQVANVFLIFLATDGRWTRVVHSNFRTVAKIYGYFHDDSRPSGGGKSQMNSSAQFRPYIAGVTAP